MNCQDKWRNTINIHSDESLLPPVSPRKSDYQLMPTGDADMNGRKYVAVPTSTKLTDKLKQKLNIW